MNRSRLRVRIFEDMNVLILLIATITAVIVFSLILGNKFFSSMNFQSMAYQIPEFGFLAIAMALCMLTGGIDLSVVSISTLSSILSAYVITGMAKNGADTTLSIILAMLVALVVSALCGLFNGMLIAKGQILPILATLSTNIFFSGIALAITSGAGVVGFPKEFLKLGLFKVFEVPVVFILLILAAAIMVFMLGRSHFGHCVYLYGESKTASLFSGISNKNLIIKTYMLSGILCGLSALITMTRVNSARVGYGETYLLQAILVSVLGGLDPNGGKGKIIGVFLGIILLQVLQSGFTLLDFKPYDKTFIWGSVLILVMIANFYIEKRRNETKKTKIKASDT